MKRILIALALLALVLPEAGAQTGAVIYSLPRTTVSLEVTAQRTAFTAGPYAQYAQKYLGVAARTQSEVTHTLTQITVTPYVEADPAVRYTVNLPDKSSATFLQFCAQGLVVMADNYTGKPASWRFTPQVGTGAFEGVDPLGNLGKETTVLYKAVRTDEGYERVPVNQEQIVEKSSDRKAAEVAEMILSLREKRLQLCTGDTDATFDESLKPALEEITRLEEKYLTLFYGVSEVSEVTHTFDVTPVAGNKSQTYTAFHVSDTKGLLPASQQEGKPYTLEFKVEPLTEAEAAADRSRETVVVHYRIPVITRCRLMQGSELVLESRVPVYQLGEESTFPLNVLITK